MAADQRRGIVDEILVAPIKGGPMDSVMEVRARPDTGLCGHHHSNLTLIEAEKIESFARAYEVLFSSYDARRNIVTRGIELNALLQSEFSIGEIRVTPKYSANPV